MSLDLRINKDKFYQNMGPKNSLAADEAYVDDILAIVQVYNGIWGIWKGKKLTQFLASIPTPSAQSG